jgi:hypothetical protein
MFKIKIFTSITIFVILSVVTSVVKNKTRIIEKQISSLNNKISLMEKDTNEAQLDFFYLTSPREIEKKISIIGFDNYQPISYSKIFFAISDLTNIQNKISNSKKINEKKIKKK